MIRNFFKKKGDTDLNTENNDREAEIVDMAPEGEEQQAEEAGQDAPAQASAAPSVEADLKNKLVRLQADFDNYRKRTAAGRQEAREEARRELLLDMLPVYDNFLRAMSHAQEQEDYGALRAGIEGILLQMQGFFQKHNLKEISAENGEAFNPTLHDAVGTVPGDIENNETIAQEVLKGFQLNGYVIRPAQVLVYAQQ